MVSGTTLRLPHSEYELEVLADWMPSYPVRRRVYAHSDYQLEVLADWIPCFLVRHRDYARSDCLLHWSADWVNLSVVADASCNTG